MIERKIQWHKPSEELPETWSNILFAADGGVYYGFRDELGFRKDESVTRFKPEEVDWWASIPSPPPVIGYMENPVQHSVQEVIDWFLVNVSDVSPKKLRGLIYYAYVWYLALANKTGSNIEHRFFEAEFEAWVHGPVCPEVHEMYEDMSITAIIPKPTSPEYHFTEDETDLLEEIKKVYGDYTGFELESIMTQEKPWRNARNTGGRLPFEWSHEKLSEKDMWEYYTERMLMDEGYKS